MAKKGAFKDRPLWRRLQAIHHAIKEGRRPNASTLARELSVSSKTVQRDLDYLRDELQAPIEYDRQENGYLYARPDYVLPFLPVDGKDLFSIGVAAQVLALLGASPLARDLKACYARLAELMPPAVRLHPETVMEMLALRANAFRPVREETWQAVVESLQRGVALSIRYRRAGEKPGEPRVLRPYALILAGRDWMLLAPEEPGGPVKSFYLARIEHAKPTVERYAIPKDFDPEAFYRDTFGIFVGGGQPFRFRVRFSPEASDEVREIRWHPKQKLETSAKGEAILELPARSVREARRFVLGYGQDAVVLAPPELVLDMKREVSALMNAYEDGDDRKQKTESRKREEEMKRSILRAALPVGLCLLTSSRCGPSGPGGLKPVSAPDAEAACPGGRSSWKLDVLDRRAERRDSEKVTALVADSIRKSFPGCVWNNAAADAPAITVEINTFSSTYSYGNDAMWDAEAIWTVSAREKGRALTEFECDAKDSQPNYRNVNNEKEVLTRVFEAAMKRALDGLRAIPAR